MIQEKIPLEVIKMERQEQEEKQEIQQQQLDMNSKGGPDTNDSSR
jgi:uncharacterized membrane protein